MNVPSEKSYQNAILSVFRRAVYVVVASIPRGQVMTYAAVAARAGNERAARAVGTAMRENRYQDVPCHRVIRTDGRIGEYAFGGSRAKRRRLEEEGVSIDMAGRVIFPF